MLVAEVDGEVAGFLAVHALAPAGARAACGGVARGRPGGARAIQAARHLHAAARRGGLLTAGRARVEHAPTAPADPVERRWATLRWACRVSCGPNRPVRSVLRAGASCARGPSLPVDAHERLRRCSAARRCMRRRRWMRCAPVNGWRRFATWPTCAGATGQFSDYRAVAPPCGREGAGAGGVAVFRCRRHGPFWVAHVCELLVAPGRRARAAGRLLRLVGEAAPVDFVSCNFDGALRGGASRFRPVPAATACADGARARRRRSRSTRRRARLVGALATATSSCSEHRVTPRTCRHVSSAATLRR